MRLQLYAGTEGFKDTDLRDGDIFAVHPNTWTPGAQEAKRFLVVEVEDFDEETARELVKSDYAPGDGDEPVIRRQRAYRIDYAPKLTPEELAAARDKEVASPVITGRFSLADIARK